MEKHTKKARAVSLTAGGDLLLAKSPIVGYMHTCTASTLLLYLTLLLNREATKAATTTMETTILTVVEAEVILNIFCACFCCFTIVRGVVTIQCVHVDH
jgi:hypothetical protein